MIETCTNIVSNEVESLNRLSDELQLLIQQFKLEANNNSGKGVKKVS